MEEPTGAGGTAGDAPGAHACPGDPQKGVLGGLQTPWGPQKLPSDLAPPPRWGYRDPPGFWGDLVGVTRSLLQILGVHGGIVSCPWGFGVRGGGSVPVAAGVGGVGSPAELAGDAEVSPKSVEATLGPPAVVGALGALVLVWRGMGGGFGGD